MSDRRMLSKKIVNNDNFIKLSAASQSLYLHLCMTADDEGFSDQVETCLFRAHAKQKDLKNLIDKKYIYQFESGVIVVKHWFMANWIRKERIKETRFMKEKAQVILQQNGAYTWKEEEKTKGGSISQMSDACHPNDSQMSDKCQPNVSQMSAKWQPNDSQMSDECLPNGSPNLTKPNYKNNISNTTTDYYTSYDMAEDPVNVDNSGEGTNIWGSLTNQDVDRLDKLYLDHIELIDQVHEYVKESCIQVDKAYQYIVGYARNVGWPRRPD